jgi:hypothetical protein
MKIAAVLFLILLPCSARAFDAWSKQDVAMEAGYAALHIIDWGQSLNVAAHPDQYHEINPIMGEHPSRGRVNLYMASSLLAHIGITHVLPAKCRPYFQGITIGIKAGVVANNLSVGLRLGF